MREIRKARSVPRATIYEHCNAAGKMTLSGLHYSDMRAILTQASLYNHDAMSKKRGADDEAYHREMLSLIGRIDAAVMDAVAATHNPAPSARTGCRRSVEQPLSRLSMSERRRRARHQKSEREWLERTVASLEAERERRAPTKDAHEEGQQ